MASCPPEFAARVDAALHRPFSSIDAPLGIWFKNNQENICLTLPDNSYYYFNTKGDWYLRKGEGDKCATVYVSPPGFRYDNPSSDNQRLGSTFVGVHWRTAAEKICCHNEFGMLCLTFRKLIDSTDLLNLPRKNIAVFTNQAGTQRVVEVNRQGIYTGSTPWLLEEIEYWHTNLVSVGDVDGPKWRGVEQRPTPPAERRARRVSPVIHGRYPPPSNPTIKREEQDGTGAQEGSIRTRHSDSRDSTSYVKKEEPEEEMGLYEAEEDVSMGQNEQYVDHEEQDMEDEDMERDQYTNDAHKDREELDELDDTPVASGSGRACMRNLLAARRPQATPVVRGARVNKNIKAKPSQIISVQRNGIFGFGFIKRSLHRSK